MVFMSIIMFGCLIVAQVPAIEVSTPDSLLSQWAAFKANYGKIYADPTEEAKRFKIYARNKLEIDRFNEEDSEQAGYTQGLNQFSDTTIEERRASNGFKLLDMLENNSGLRPNSTTSKYLAELLNNDDEPIPSEVDWRKDARVTSIKNQGDCGSCWAFAAIGLLEGQEKVVLNSSEPTDLSVQQLVDCSGQWNCGGGGLPEAMNSILAHHGLMTDKDYPYIAKNGPKCQFDKSKVFMSPKNYTILPKNDEPTLQKVVAKYGPVAVSIDSVYDSFYHYKGGVYSYHRCGLALSHCVIVVGYGTDPKQGDYWLLKNSWGEDWGEKGYMRLKMHQNLCLIAYQPIIANF